MPYLTEEEYKELEADASDGKALRAENAKLREALKPCVALLDGLVKESKRSIDWGEEDSFRRGEWFEREDIDAIEAARHALESSNG